MPQITIGPSYFAKERNDYAEWQWAYVREAAQNGIDARGSSELRFTIDLHDGNTRVVFENNGKPMDRDIIVNKLLALGESGKNFEDGSIGGFGKAKILLYMMNKSYVIRSGTCEVRGEGGSYDLSDDLPYYHGTRSEVIIAGDEVDEFVDAVSKFASYAQWSGDLYLNGDSLNCSLHKGSARRDLGFGKVYTNRQCENRMVIRIGGIPMFTTSCLVNRCVVVELTGDSKAVLTANRDGLRYPYSSQLNSFVAELAVDKKSALKENRGPTYTVYDGAKHAIKTKQQDISPITVAALAGVPAYENTDVGDEFETDEALNAFTERESVSAGSSEIAQSERAPNLTAPMPTRTNSDAKPRLRNGVAGYFVVKNETSMQVPAYFMPHREEFSEYSRKVVKVWTRMLYTLHTMFGNENAFGVGFIFSDDTEAEFESSDLGRMYYINPAVIVEQESSRSKSFSKRYKLTAAGKKEMLAVAVHEFVHGHTGRTWHDEQFACTLTEMTGKVMANMSKFNWCFQ